MTTWLFWVSLLLAVASFCVFAYLAIASVRPKPRAPAPNDPVPRGGGVPTPGDVADLAEKLGKAGPMATAASLSVFFLIVAAAASGLVKVAVDASS